MDIIKTKLVQLMFNGQTEIDIDKVDSDVNLVNDLGFDSIRIVKLIMDIEDEFGISLYSDNIDFEDIVYFNRLLETIKSKT